MKFLTLACMALLMLLSACGQANGPADPVRAPLKVTGIAAFTLYQRSTIALPGSAGELLMTIDDITAGQTMTTLEWRDGTHLVGPRSLRVDDSLDFSVAGQPWRLTLVQMHNELIGNDWADFTLQARPPAGHLTSEQEIEALIGALEALDDAEFVRNGQVYSAGEAAAHLREKWRTAGTEIASAEDFIREIGSRSASSGAPYMIRLPDGSSTSAETWLRAQLKQLRAQVPDPTLQQV